MGAKYGLASATADIMGGIDSENKRVATEKKAAVQGEADQLKLKSMRSKLQQEGTADALKLMLSGDIEGAMTKYNETGEDRMSNLEFNPDDGLVSWTDAKGNQRDSMVGQLMVAAGLNPKDLDTPDKKLGRDKELVQYKAQMDKKYGLGRAGKDNRTAYIQNLEYTMKTLTGGDPQKAFKLMQLSKSDPQTAYARVLISLQKQNEEKFDDEKMTEEEMRKAAKDSVSSFRKDMFNGLFKQDQQDTQPQQQNQYGMNTVMAPQGQPQQGQQKDNYSSLWR